VNVTRSINSNIRKRGPAREILVTNFQPERSSSFTMAKPSAKSRKVKSA
jgi:hypothetical protein